MKNKILIGFIVVFGVVGGYFLSSVQIPNSTPKPSIPETKTKPVDISNELNLNVNFVVRERFNAKPDDQKKIDEVKNLLGTNIGNFEIVYDRSRQPFISLKQILNDQNNAGILDATRVVQMAKNKSNKINAMFSTSPLEDLNCSSEVVFLTKKNGSEKSLIEFSQKNLGFTGPSQQMLNIKLKEQKKEKLKFNKIFEISNNEEGLKALADNQIDVLAARIQRFGDSKTIFVVNDKEVDLNGLEIQIVEITDYKLPCKIIFTKQLSDIANQQFKNNFISAFQQKDKLALLEEVIGARSIYEISSKRWEEINDAAEKSQNIRIKKFCNEFIKQKNN